MRLGAWRAYARNMPKIRRQELEELALLLRPVALANFAFTSEKPGKLLEAVMEMYGVWFEEEKTEGAEDGRLGEEKSKRLDAKLRQMSAMGDRYGKKLNVEIED